MNISLKDHLTNTRIVFGNVQARPLCIRLLWRLLPLTEEQTALANDFYQHAFPYNHTAHTTSAPAQSAIVNGYNKWLFYWSG